MTPEELDRARAQEAYRIHARDDDETMLECAARLAREGWTPPPALPADLMRAREIVAGCVLGCVTDYLLRGDWDDDDLITSTRIALHDTSQVIPTEVDDEMLEAFIKGWNRSRSDSRTDHMLFGLRDYNAYLRYRAAKQMEALG